jgi:hypothetical protein
MRCLIRYIFAVLILSCVGCRHIIGGKAACGTETFEALQKAVVKASASVKSSVVLVIPAVSGSQGGGHQLTRVSQMTI